MFIDAEDYFFSARDPEARTAMLVWREVRNIAMNTPAKYVEIKRLLRLYASDQIILYWIADQPSSLITY
jgi:hypothetical protein